MQTSYGQPATAAPKPVAKPSAAPKAFTYSGYTRSYYFTRTNAVVPGLPQTNVLNQASLNTAVAMHGAYAISHRWSIAGTYLYANPLNGCNTPLQQLQIGGNCSGHTTTHKVGGQTVAWTPEPTNPDNTLPGFALSTAYEAYLRYGDAHTVVKIGNQLLTTPWANGADTRLKPAAYQGIDVTDKFNANWSSELAYIDRYESRVDSAFLRSTLLTATNMADAPGPGANLLIPKFSSRPTGGFGYFRYGYASPSFAANVHFYDFLDIATAQWFDARWQLHGYTKPFIAFHGGSERQSGRAVIGTINSQDLGVQTGFSPSSAFDFTLGADFIPQKTQTFATLPAGIACTAVPKQPPAKTPTGNQIAVTGTTPLMMFLPTGGTPNCRKNADGSTSVYYGGWASPYTDSYTSDPLYTTSMTGGMVERRSPGASAKATATWYAYSRQIRLIGSYAMYEFGNSATGYSPQSETDLDATYYFSHVQSGIPYHGFSLRHRYGERDIKNAALYGGLPVFKYNRTQLEYDF